MPQIAICPEDILKSRIRIREIFSRSYLRLYERMEEYPGADGDSRVYRAVEEGFTVMDALGKRLKEMSGGREFSTLVPAYISSEIALSRLGESSGDGENFFAGNRIDFSDAYPFQIRRLAKFYSDALEMENGNGLEELAQEYFEWMRELSLEAREDFPGAEGFLQENHVLVMDREFSGFEIPSRRIHTKAPAPARGKISGRQAVKAYGGKIEWGDFTGYDNVREYFEELALIINNRAKAESYMEKPIPKGILLYGPPGTGKTTAARKFCEGAGVPFEYLDAVSIGSSWVNQSAGNLQKRFDDAARKIRNGAKASILFIDEVDALGARRYDRRSSKEDDKVAEVLNVNMDGERAVQGVIVIGATNRADRIDPALLRGGRFSARFEMGYPDLATIGKMYQAKLEAAKSHAGMDDFMGAVGYSRLGEMSRGFSGADVEEVVKRVLRKNLVSGLRGGTIPRIEAEAVEREIAEYRRKE